MSRSVLLTGVLVVVGVSASSLAEARRPAEACGPVHEGTYDATVTMGEGGEFGALAAVRQRDIGIWVSVEFDLLNGLWLEGTPAADGSFDLEGYQRFESDILLYATGRACGEDSGDEQRVHATVDVEPFIDPPTGPVDIDLRRPASGTPVSFAGVYRLRFSDSPSGCDCASSADLSLVVFPDGFGSFADTDERSGDTVVASLSSGYCQVSPTGRLSCGATYSIALDRQSLVFDGILSGDTGQGFYVLDPHPGRNLTGEWSISRVADLPTATPVPTVTASPSVTPTSTATEHQPGGSGCSVHESPHSDGESLAAFVGAALLWIAGRWSPLRARSPNP